MQLAVQTGRRRKKRVTQIKRDNCPGEKELRLRRLARSASGLFWEYQADKRDCAACPLHDKGLL